MSNRQSRVEPEGLPLSLKKWLHPQPTHDMDQLETEDIQYVASDHSSWDGLFDEYESGKPLNLNGKLVPTRFIHSDPETESENENDDDDEDDMFVFEEKALFTGSQ